MNQAESQVLMNILDGLMVRYKERVPDVKKIMDAMCASQLIQSEADIINDHIAFRTLAVPHLGIQSLEKIFLRFGYQKKDFYHFKAKKLDAFWYAPPQDIPNLPRIFISECRVQDFSQSVQDLVYSYTNEVKSDPVSALDLLNPQEVDSFLHGSLWRDITYEDYQLVLSESEYIAWVLNNQYYLNHFTISIHELSDPYHQIDVFNEFLESIGVVLNDSGSKIKTSQDGKLLQSSSVSQQHLQSFRSNDGRLIELKVPGSYVEFAQRIAGRDGFDAGNADRIFESTYQDQVDKD